MGLVIQEVTAPTSEPITLDEAKEHMRVDFSDDDTYIGNLITAMRQLFQKDIAWRTLVTTTWRQRFETFPLSGTAIILPLPPLATVVHLKYYNTSGTQTTIDSDDYNTDTDSEPGRVLPDYAEVWPTTRAEPGGAVEVQFTAGTALASVTEKDKMAIKCMVAELYVRREEPGNRASFKNPAVLRLLRSGSRRRFV